MKTNMKVPIWVWVFYLIAVSADDGTILTSVDSDPKSFDQVLCAQSWVESCSKVTVDFRKIGKSSMKLPVGGKFTKSKKDKVMFVSPDLNLTYYQYTGDRGDSAMIQLIKDRDAEKLSLYAFIRGDQYNVMGCGTDCHLWVKTKYKERTL